MKFSLRIRMIPLLLLMITVYTTQATSIVRSRYEKLESGLNVTGTIAGEYTTKSNIECSDK